MKKRLLIIRSSKDSSWGSCKVISPNLQATYNNLNDPNIEIEYFSIPERFLKEETLGKNYIGELAKRIKTFKPTELVFIDHMPAAPKILSFLTVLIPLDDLPELIFHIYGDFTFYSSDWNFIGSQLKGHLVKFIVASESQKRQLSYFSQDGEYIENFLFPVNDEEYFFSLKERKSVRHDNGVNDNEKVILYAGRVSQQKNVDILIREFSNLCSHSKEPLRLWIAGAFDDIGASFIGVRTFPGFYFSKIQSILDELPAQIVEKIHFFGQLGKTDLRKVKNAADVFVSLSLHHDEDYGMSPAEALSCGLPTILTDWGGYSSFASEEWNCRLIPVELTPYGHKIEVDVLADFIEQCDVAEKEDVRRIRSEKFQQAFSIKGSIAQLHSLLKKDGCPFPGFKWNLGYFAIQYWSVSPGRELNKELIPSSENYYYEVYKNYISSNFSEKKK